MANLGNFLQNRAKNIFEPKSFDQEFKSFIASALVLKLFSMGVGVYAGYFWFYSFIRAGYPEAAAVGVSVFLLVLLETLNAVSISKALKMYFVGKIRPFWVLSFISLCMYSVSFFVGVEGLKARQTDKLTNEGAILEKYKAEQNNLDASFTARLSELKTQIETIKSNPQGWNQGKRDKLTAAQMSDITKIYDNIAKLQTEQRAELAKLATERQSEIEADKSKAKDGGERYGLFVSIVMVLQLLCNVFLAYAYNRIYNDAKPETERMQGIQTQIKDKYKDFETELIKGVEKSVFERLTAFYASLNIELPKQGTTGTTTATGTGKNPIGFALTKTSETSEQKTATTGTYGGVVSNPTAGVTYCQNCGLEYQKRAFNQRFCCEGCRVESWEHSNGRKMKQAKK